MSKKKIFENPTAAWNDYNKKGTGTIQEYEAFKAAWQYAMELAKEYEDCSMTSLGLKYKTKEQWSNND